MGAGRRAVAVGRRAASCLALVTALVTALVITGCSHAAQEPGLFGHSTPTPSPDAPDTSTGRAGVPQDGVINPDLPVLGERIWVSGDGAAVPFRIAVHGLRRIAGGTILDWSITPLPRVGLDPGQQLPDHVGLGPAGDPLSFRLIDTLAGRVYRPLIGKGRDDCLRTVPGSRLEIGQTLVQQLAFPAMPAGIHPVAVDIPSVALFTGVPLPDPGRLVRAVQPVDLARAPDVTDVIRWTPEFAYRPAGGQRFRIGIMSVDATSDATSVVWSIWSLTDGDGLEPTGAPPITDTLDSAAELSTASALRIAVSADGAVPAGRPQAAWREKAAGDRSTGRCLCTDLRGWAAGMTTARRSVTVVTNLPPLPLHAERVDAIFPDLARIDRIDVGRPGGAGSSYGGFIADTGDHWGSSAPYQVLGWPVEVWPTPRPDASMVRFFDTSVGRLR
jgi:hypothetical protein